MNIGVSQAIQQEMGLAKDHFARGELEPAFHRLERAHILGQRSTWHHALTHLWMLRIGWCRRDTREVLGQGIRVLAALLFSRIWVPVGNTGGANVSAMKPMPIPEDLQDILSQDL